MLPSVEKHASRHAMTRIVTTHYRYKAPPRKRKAVAIEGPAIVRKDDARPTAEPDTATDPPKPPANDAREPMIVMPKPKRHFQEPLPMELTQGRRPVVRDGDDYKRLRAAMTRRIRGE